MFTDNIFMQAMARKITGGTWPMKTDRELIALSKTHTLNSLADHFECHPKTILAKAKRLGLSIKQKSEMKNS
jgi:hypothetical protein